MTISYLCHITKSHIDTADQMTNVEAYSVAICDYQVTYLCYDYREVETRPGGCNFLP